MEKARLGEILVQERLVTTEHVSAALARKRSLPDVPLGQILCEMGHLSSASLQSVLDKHGKRPKIGHVFLQRNWLDEPKLAQGLALSREEKTLVGKALMKLGFVTEEQVAQGVSWQYDLPYLPLQNVPADYGLVGFINSHFATMNRIVPVSRIANTVTVAMAYPLQGDIVNKLETARKVRIHQVISGETEIARIQRQLYRVGADLPQSREEHFEFFDDHPGEKGKIRHSDDVVTPETANMLKRIVSRGIKEGASDVHIETKESGVDVRYRIDGLLQTFNEDRDESLKRVARAVVTKIKILCDMDVSERRRPQDGSFRMQVGPNGSARSFDFRVSTLPTQYGEDVVIRILDKNAVAPSLDSLGFSVHCHEELRSALDVSSGLFLVAGPTGAGKTATLQALMTLVNRPHLKSLSIEDPISHQLQGVRQVEINDPLGNTYPRFLRAFLRQDPDNILIDEIRDADTADIAVRAALAGRTIMTSLQASDVASVTRMLIDFGVEPSFLASSLRGVIAQRLVRILCPECKKLSQAPRESRLKFLLPADAALSLYQPVGCSKCNFTGFKGRRPIVELWVPTTEELLFVNLGSDSMSLREKIFADGGRRTLLEDGLRRVVAGETTLEELLRVVPFAHVSEMRSRLEKRPFSWSPEPHPIGTA